MSATAPTAMVHILTVSGSLQAASGNARLLALAAAVAPVGVAVSLAQSVGELPHFNPDLDVRPVPEPVVVWRAQLAAADAVLIAAPEYARSLPGALKDALDWIVGSGELYGKPVALLSSANIETRGQLGRAALEQTLRAQGAHVVASATAVSDTAAETVAAAFAALLTAVRSVRPGD
jgi:chromate reductase